MKTKIPKGQIEWLVNRHHVTESDEIIRDDIESRMDDPKFTPAIRRKCVAYAIRCHNKNRDLYARVMTGNLGFLA